MLFPTAYVGLQMSVEAQATPCSSNLTTQRTAQILTVSKSSRGPAHLYCWMCSFHFFYQSNPRFLTLSYNVALTKVYKIEGLHISSSLRSPKKVSQLHAEEKFSENNFYSKMYVILIVCTRILHIPEPRKRRMNHVNRGISSHFN